MKIDSLTSVKMNTEGSFDTVNQYDAMRSVSASPIQAPIVTKVQDTSGMDSGDGDSEEAEDSNAKDPTQKTIDAMMSEANQKLGKTRCEYSYDEPTRRVSIKVYDKETDELIREVPPEKSLEVLQRIWELAGIIVDERR